MYYCYVHNWSSQNYSCPSCHKIDTFASNSVCIDRRYDLHDKILEIDKLKKEINSLQDKLYHASRQAEENEYLRQHEANERDKLRFKLKIAIKALKDIDKGKLPIGNIVYKALDELRKKD